MCSQVRAILTQQTTGDIEIHSPFAGFGSITPRKSRCGKSLLRVLAISGFRMTVLSGRRTGDGLAS